MVYPIFYPYALLKRIDEKKALIEKQRPLSAAVINKIREQFAIEMTYNSNAIEGTRSGRERIDGALTHPR